MKRLRDEDLLPTPANLLQRYTRVELTEEGLRAGACRQRVGTVTGYDAHGNLHVLPDGRSLVGHYSPSHWQPISLALLRRDARLPPRYRKDGGK